MTSLDQPTLPFGDPQLPFEEPLTPLPSARAARPAPPDQAARDGVRTRLDATLFVEAGAGTGKTTALVARIVELVRSGAEVHRIAAITFTEAAASELRDRVRHALEQAVAEGTVRPEAVVELDNAAISTLHGFAQRLISEHPIEAGLPPEVEVLDEIQSSIEFENRWAAFVDELFERPDLAEVLLRSFATNLNLASLRAVALAFQDQRDRLHPAGPPPESPVRPVDAVPVVEAIRKAVEWTGHCTVDDDKLLGHLQGLALQLRSLELATSDLEVLHLLATSPRYASNLGKAQAWTDGCKIDVVAALDGAEQARHELLTDVRSEVLERLLEEVRQFTLRSARDRMRAGRLVFHDLLVAARDLLRASPAVRASLHDRYRHLLIDEFQDTDPLQVELAVLLATRGDVPSASSLDGWEGVALDPGRLFFVGDAKQSIYRFRRADVGLFLHVRETLADETLRLTTNFRSVPDITSWVNHAFADLIGEGVAGSQPRYDELKAAREATAGPRRVVVLGRTHDAPIGTVREIEAAEIAGTVRAAVDDGWPVRDRARPDADVDVERPARWADIAVLLPTRTSLPQLEAAFETAGIPYRVISSSLVWSTQEVRDLLNILQAIDDPTDEVALVAALRSPALACSDDDLLSYRRAGGRWDVRSRPPDSIDPDHPVLTALQTVGRLRRQRWWLGVSGLVDQIVRDLRLFELAFAHDRPRDRWRRLRFVLDQARTFERTPGATLRQFLTWAERQATDVARVREPSLPESDDDAVQILTVHGAKGLEFPITVVTGLNRRPDPRVATVVWNDAGRPEVGISSFKTGGYETMVEVERALDQQESTRLLYVATTRAQDHLVLSLHRPDKKPHNTHAHALARICEADPELWRPFEPPSVASVGPVTKLPPAVDPEPLIEAGERAWAERCRMLEARRRRPSSAATAINTVLPPDAPAGSLDADGLGPIVDDKPEAGPEAPTWRRGRAGTAIGRAVHAVLQTVDLATGDDIDKTARAQASAEGVDDAAPEIARAVQAALGSDVVREAVGRPHWREVYVAAPVGSTLVEGFIDLLVDTPEGLLIVDYKTDQARSDEAVDAAVARYRLQMATYALVLEESLGRPVAGAALLFVSGGAARTRAVADLDAAVAEVRARLGAVA